MSSFPREFDVYPLSQNRKFNRPKGFRNEILHLSPSLHNKPQCRELTRSYTSVEYFFSRGLTIAYDHLFLSNFSDSLLESESLETGECRADAEIEFNPCIHCRSLSIIQWDRMLCRMNNMSTVNKIIPRTYALSRLLNLALLT